MASRNTLCRSDVRKLEDFLLANREAIEDATWKNAAKCADMAQAALGFIVTPGNIPNALEAVGLTIGGKVRPEPPALAALAALLADLYKQSSLVVPPILRPFLSDPGANS